MRNLRRTFFPALLLSIFSCSPPEETVPVDTLDQIAEDYVRLCLEIGHYDSDFVDAYYGPEELQPPDSILNDEEVPFDELKWRAITLLEKVERMNSDEFTEEEIIRMQNLEKQLQAVSARLYILIGEELPFDKESKMLYDAIAPAYDYDYYDSLLALLDDHLPGSGPISERYDSYSKQFIIPADKLDTLFNLAISEARNRTKRFIDLPDEESFTLEYVNDKPWSGYNWYKGNAYSLIQLNTDLPIAIDRVIDLASHEGYPGHHVFNVLLEQNLVNKRNWVEYSIYPLFSPQSLIAEGSANFGIEVAFPDDERIEYERETLWPIADLPVEEVNDYYDIQKVRSKLSYAGNDIARSYFSGEIDENEAVELMMKYLLYTRERAEQRLDFVGRYRSYIINYNYGQDIIRNWMADQLGENNTKENRWKIFAELLSFPRSASQLIE